MTGRDTAADLEFIGYSAAELHTEIAHARRMFLTGHDSAQDALRAAAARAQLVSGALAGVRADVEVFG